MSTIAAEIRLLGPPALRLDGRPARLHSSKTLALLAYLLLEGAPNGTRVDDVVHSREKLADLMWGGSPGARARQSLRQALYSLRRTFGQDCIAVEGETVAWIAGSRVWVDAVEFRSLSADLSADLSASGQAAVALYRGTLLEGADPPDCPAFEEWLFFQRDSLEQRLADLLQQLVDARLKGAGPAGAALDQGAYQEALAYGQRLVALNPLHEGAHRRLMRVYGALGDADGVRRRYLACRETLERELGVGPSRDTEALYRALVAQIAAHTAAQTAAPPTAPQPAAAPSRDAPPQESDHPPALPFGGRKAELRALTGQFERVLGGEGRLVLVAGEAGAGKTRLVDAFLEACCRQAPGGTLAPGGTMAPGESQAQVLAGRCYAPESHAPYAMWTDALGELALRREPGQGPSLDGLNPAWHRQVARLAPALGPPAGDIEGVTPAESRLRLLQGIVQALAYLARQQPTIVWFDDLHWADEASLELLHYVARQLTGQPLLLLGTYRSGASSDNPALQRLLSSPRVAHTVRLDALPLADVRQMLRQAGIAAAPASAQRLYRQSQGNPLYLVETLNTLYESGHVHRRAGGATASWTVDQDKPWPVPARVLDLIRARAASLNEEQRRVLAAAAVIGRPFGLRLLRLVSGLPEPQALDALDQVLRSGYLDEQPAGTHELQDGPALAFHHDYSQHAIYGELSVIQRRALHRRAADALVQLYRVHPQAVTKEIAFHYEQAGDPAAVTYLAQAARQAQALYAYQHAVELCTRALELLDGQEPARRFELLLVREEALDRQGLRSEQAADVAEIARLAEALGDVERQAIAGLREAGHKSYTGQVGGARQAGERALALYREAGDAEGQGRALRELGFLSWTAEDYPAALAYVREALKLHRQRGDLGGEATALHNLAEVHRSLGSPQQSIAEYETALELYWARQDHQRQGLTLYGLGTAYRQLGELDEAARRYRQALEQCETAGDRLMVSRVRHALAGLHTQRREDDLALEQMRQALATSREIGYGPGIAYGLIVTSQLHANAGRTDAARAHLEDALTWMRLTEDEPGLAEVQARLQALRGSALQGSALQQSEPQQGALPPATLLPSQLGWVKGHVALAEGKVYCAFESPLAGCMPDEGRPTSVWATDDGL